MINASANVGYTYRRALIELFFAAILWGAGFVFVRYALETLSPLWLTTFRFGLASATGLIWVAFSKTARASFSRRQMFLAAIPGLALGAALIFQTYGLRYTLVGKSSFITVLYVVIVPFFETYLFKTKIPTRHWFAVAVAILGTFFLTGMSWDGWNLGDVLTLGCAFLSAIQIVDLHRVSHKIGDATAFNTFQFMWAMLLPLPMALSQEVLPSLPWPTMTVFSLLFLSIVCTQVAFAIQIRAQKLIPSSTVSMLFLLESPFAALFAGWCFAEVMSVSQWAGAALISIAAVLAVYRMK